MSFTKVRFVVDFVKIIRITKVVIKISTREVELSSYFRLLMECKFIFVDSTVLVKNIDPSNFAIDY